MPQEVRSLSAEQLLLITLVVKVAVAATLATMLVRFGQFRRILLTEKRAWRERLTFAFAFGIPVSIGVAARLLLSYNAGDLSLAGSFLAGLTRRSLRRCDRRLSGRAARPDRRRVDRDPLVGRVRLRRRWSTRGLAERSDLARDAVARHRSAPTHVEAVPAFPHRLAESRSWRRRSVSSWLRQMLGLRFGAHRLYYLEPTNPWLFGLVVLTTVPLGRCTDQDSGIPRVSSTGSRSRRSC